MHTPEQEQSSPNWSSTTKLVIGLTLVGLVAALLVYFRGIIGPLLLAIILAYLLHPLADRLSKATHLKWRMSVNLIYIVFVILLIGFVTLAGLAIVQQLQSLVRVVQIFVNNTLPQLLEDYSQRQFTFGPLPFQFSLGQFDLQSITDQLISTLQSTLGRVGSLVGSLATGAATFFGWGLFIILISYFLLADAGQVPNQMVRIEIPGYDQDLRRLGRDLIKIWNAFLRGQLIIFIMVILIYTLLLTILGVRYAFGIALLAGLARFVPYVGPLITWIVLVLVTLLQGSNYFGLPTWQFIILVLGLSILLDQILDQVVTPRFMGQTLNVHPAAVLIAALIAANLIGIIGLVLAAPVLATLKLLTRYTLRKMLDLDPWPEADQDMRPIEMPGVRTWRQIRTWVRTLWQKGISREKN
jgi:predicted PurR-regulated permease PerM